MKTRTAAYLAPEIPALSATFVYQELLEVERRGCRVVPFSVHRPQHEVPAQQISPHARKSFTTGRGGR